MSIEINCDHQIHNFSYSFNHIFEKRKEQWIFFCITWNYDDNSATCQCESQLHLFFNILGIRCGFSREKLTNACSYKSTVIKAVKTITILNCYRLVTEYLTTSTSTFYVFLSQATYDNGNISSDLRKQDRVMFSFPKSTMLISTQTYISEFEVKNPNSIHTSSDSHPCEPGIFVCIVNNKKSSAQRNINRLESSYAGSRNQNLFNKNNKYVSLFSIWNTAILLQKQNNFMKLLLLMVMLLARSISCNGLMAVDPRLVSLSDGLSYPNSDSSIYNSSINNSRIGGKQSVVSGLMTTGTGVGVSSASSTVGSSGHYFDKLDNLERSVAAVLIKVAYGTTSTTKRSIPDNNYVPSLTTVATPPLTTLRYFEKSLHNQQVNLHHRNYELDLERDHALPTSAPNADILKSNSNPSYPNPNRHHNHERERHRHIFSSTASPSMSNIIKKNNGQSQNIPIYPGDMPSYSPPARSFFTPPLPPEYQNPFADKPTLRGTNNEGIIANTGTYINRRPIPPPSLMPGHERIPFRPPDLAGALGGSLLIPNSAVTVGEDTDRKKALNTPSKGNGAGTGQANTNFYNGTNQYIQETTTQTGNIGSSASGVEDNTSNNIHNTRKEILPSIRRILSGSNGNKGEIPEVLLKQVTSRPLVNYHLPPSSPVVLLDNLPQENKSDDINGGSVSTSNINKSKNNKDIGTTDDDQGNTSTNLQGNERKSQSKIKMSTKSTDYSDQIRNSISSTTSFATEIGEVAAAAATSTSSTTRATDAKSASSSSPTSSSSSSSSTAAHSTWTVAWNIHVYLSVILFTILGVYSFYKMLTYNKLTHLFSQSYFVCIHLILIIICSARIFYLCYDAYNIHSTFHVFVSEILLNLPATFLTISFSVLILFLFLKSLNHKNNRYSALIRPLTVVVGCGVHVVLCITLHYVESYTMQNHQQHLYYHQQFYRRQQQFVTTSTENNSNINIGNSVHHNSGTTTVPSPPPRVLSLICQIIYIFICLSLGLLYLYIYRILKRILRSKSQNYIHGFQNLSYAIHITIATALLFVLLAALQIFGAISISITRPLIAPATSEMDWLQWGYQFSLRLIEIAIITLLSWVAGLKTSAGGLDAVVGDTRGVGGGVGSAGSSGVFGTGSAPDGREKLAHHNHHHSHHTNVAGFFLPCTSSSSQEQFETDYPAVCNANTNLHTYTMRTGKLIYDDSFALNSLGGGQSSTSGGRNAEFHLQQSTYQRPYDTGSLHSSVNQNNIDFSSQGTMPGNNHYHHHSNHQYADYLTDATTDHYENPNFELRGNNSNAVTLQKITAQPSTTSTTASCSGGSGTSGASQQQMLLLQSDSCYSEPVQQNYNIASTYEFNNFERPKFSASSGHQALHDGWSDQHTQPIINRDKKSCSHIERSTYDNPERRSSNSTHSCSSGGGRYTNYNSFEIDHGVRKSGTLNNIAGGGITHCRGNTTSSATTQRATGVHTLATSDRNHQQQHQSQRSGRNMLRSVGNCREREMDRESGDFNFGRTSLERSSKRITQQHSTQQNSDDDMMLPGSNAEHTNLINNEDDSCIPKKKTLVNPNDQSIGTKPNSISFNGSDRLNKPQFPPHNKIAPNNVSHHHFNHISTQSNGIESVASLSPNSAESSTASGDSVTSGSMLVAEHGFVRFRAIEDMNTDQGVGIHHAPVRNKNRPGTSAEQVQQTVSHS